MRRRVLAYLVAALVIGLLWEALSRIAGSGILPAPLPVLHRLFLVELGNPVFLGHASSSAWRIGAGIAAAFLVAVPLGLLAGSSRRAGRVADPFIAITYPVPKIVFLPLVLVLFGLGDLAKIVLIALVVFFQLLITTRDAARQVPPEMLWSLRSLGGNRWDLLRHVIWPSCLPGIITSLRITTGTAVAVLFFVESIGTRRGLGLYILDTWGRTDYEGMFAGIGALSLLGIALYEFFDILERGLGRWKGG
jgi:NitT/TauT family transport system permease protein